MQYPQKPCMQFSYLIITYNSFFILFTSILTFKTITMYIHVSIYHIFYLPCMHMDWLYLNVSLFSWVIPGFLLVFLDAKHLFQWPDIGVFQNILNRVDTTMYIPFSLYVYPNRFQTICTFLFHTTDRNECRKTRIKDVYNHIHYKKTSV